MMEGLSKCRLIYSYEVNDRVNDYAEVMTESIESKVYDRSPEEDYVCYIFSRYVKNMTRDRFGKSISWRLTSYYNGSYSITYRYWRPTESPDNGYDEIESTEYFTYYEDMISNTLKTILLNIRYLIDNDVSWVERKQKEESDARKGITEGKKRKKTKIQDPAEVSESE